MKISNGSSHHVRKDLKIIHLLVITFKEKTPQDTASSWRACEREVIVHEDIELKLNSIADLKEDDPETFRGAM